MKLQAQHKIIFSIFKHKCQLSFILIFFDNFCMCVTLFWIMWSLWWMRLLTVYFLVMTTVKSNCTKTVLELDIFLVLFSDLQWKTFTRQQAEADFKMRKESRRDYHKLIYGQSTYTCVCRWNFNRMIYGQNSTPVSVGEISIVWFMGKVVHLCL